MAGKRNGRRDGAASGASNDAANGARSAEKPVAIVGARIIDGSGGDPVENGALLIEGERIAAVGRRDQVHIPRGAVVVEAEGATVLPGLIDCHVHLAGQWGYDLLRGLLTPPSLALLYAVPNCRATLEGGITSVRDAGGTPAGVKMAVERGLFPGPRMQVAVAILSQTGGHGDSVMPSGVDLHGPVGAHSADIPDGVVDGEDEMRQRTRELLRAGADWIKLCTSGGVLSSADSPRSAQFTIEEIGVAVYEAAAQDKRAMAHAQSLQGIKNALKAGIASIEHGIWLDDEAIQMMLDRDVYLVPTLKAPEDVVRAAEAHPGMMPDYAVAKARAVMSDHRASFRRAVEAGVKVAMGTDAGVGPHGENAREVVLMAQHGMTPMQAIVATTSTAATLLHLDSAVGTLAPGKLADILVVDGDPLADIAIIADPACRALVLKGGAPVTGRLSVALSARQPVTMLV
ncbi:MAG TPA: amidohydrolase family protein [Ktedonobacterales bacterium]|nr:amidohydrolase family protein [Ktedonobacterales bacterium]